MQGDVTDILAVILGVWFTIRKLDAQKRRPEEFPAVAPDAFLSWQREEVRVYQIAVWACFLKVIVNVAFLLFVVPTAPWALVRGVGAGIFFAWAGVVAWTFWRGGQSRRRRRDLGIILGGFVVEEPRSEEEEHGQCPSPGPTASEGLDSEYPSEEPVGPGTTRKAD